MFKLRFDSIVSLSLLLALISVIGCEYSNEYSSEATVVIEPNQSNQLVIEPLPPAQFVPDETTASSTRVVGSIADDNDEPIKLDEPSLEQDRGEKSGTIIPAASVAAQDDHDGSSDSIAEQPNESAVAEEQTIDIPATWKRLGQHEIWIDFKNHLVVMGGNICLTQGQLEMFVCPVNTKEHESVIAVNAMSSEMHAALVALGAEPGKPSQWDPEYKAASGPVIDVQIMWRDSDMKKTITRPAREMIQNFHTQKPMTHEWVFGGSQFWKDPVTGEEVYYANSGEMICLSNFSTASMDLNVESSQSNDGLLFRAFTENIPPLGTKVYVVLKPGKRIGEANTKSKPDPKAESNDEKKNE